MMRCIGTIRCVVLLGLLYFAAGLSAQAAFGRGAERSAQLLSSGQAALQDEMYEQAIDYLSEYTRTVRGKSRRAEGALLWAAALRRSGKGEEALQLLDKYARRTGSDELDQQFVLAHIDCLLELERPMEALQLVDQLMEEPLETNILLQAFERKKEGARLQGDAAYLLDVYQAYDEQFSGTVYAADNMLEWGEELLEMQQPEAAFQVMDRLSGGGGAKYFGTIERGPCLRRNIYWMWGVSRMPVRH